ncbi:MATE family efflux transporter [Natronospora cellulosivora (SeqCode)]
MNLYLLYSPVWRKALILSWPIVLNHVFVTAMRTVDMILMGFFGPAAVAAVGLGDVWERIVLRIGLGLGTGGIALISQQTGADLDKSANNSDIVLTQVLITGAIVGIPFILIGWLIPEKLIRILGADSDVIFLGAQYLMAVFSAAPFRIISLIAGRALQGTGDTRTPMIVGIISNAVNIALSLVLALGIGIFPELGVVGVGIGTFVAKLLDSIIYTVIFILPGGKLSLSRPSKDWDLTISKQLLKVGIPSSLQGGYESLITFPFNALLLLIGTEAAAAYHIGRRIQQQLMAPLSRAYGTVTTIMSGHKLGAGQAEESKKIAKGIICLTAMTLGFLSIVLFIFAPQIVRIFSDDISTMQYSIGFLRALAFGAPLLAFSHVISGLLTAAGDTRTPFYGVLINQTLFKLGLAYFLSVTLNWNLTGIYIALVLEHLGQLIWVARRFKGRKWIIEAQQMINERNTFV